MQFAPALKVTKQDQNLHTSYFWIPIILYSNGYSLQSYMHYVKQQWTHIIHMLTVETKLLNNETTNDIKS